jgi:hypothetical protein
VTGTCGHQRTEVVPIAFLRRLLGLDRSDEIVEARGEAAAPPPAQAPPAPLVIAQVACPNCGIVLDPPPRSTRLCPRCRHRIVVRRSEGRTIYLTEAAVEVFESERRRGAEEEVWTRQRRSWLQLAQTVNVPADRRQRLSAAPLSAEVVRAARSLYLVAAERAIRAARHERRWEDVSRLRRRQAAAIYEEDGGHPPPSDEVLALHRDGMAATLRELATISRDAELVGAACCSACRAENEHIFRIADELRTPRLPHAGCPHGLCACDWWPAVRKAPPKRQRRRAVATAARPAKAVGSTGPAGGQGGDADDPDDRAMPPDED